MLTSGPNVATAVVQTSTGAPFWYNPLGDTGTPDASNGIVSDGIFAEVSGGPQSEYLQYSNFGSFSLPANSVITGILIEILGGSNGFVAASSMQFGQFGVYGTDFAPSANWPGGNNSWFAVNTDTELGGLTWTDASDLQFQIAVNGSTSGVADVDNCRATVYYYVIAYASFDTTQTNNCVLTAVGNPPASFDTTQTNNCVLTAGLSVPASFDTTQTNNCVLTAGLTAHGTLHTTQTNNCVLTAGLSKRGALHTMQTNNCHMNIATQGAGSWHTTQTNNCSMSAHLAISDESFIAVPREYGFIAAAREYSFISPTH